ncbi:MAG: hypothetical protein ACYDAQ_19405, partial [Mycobacteriales bacterium]
GSVGHGMSLSLPARCDYGAAPTPPPTDRGRPSPRGRCAGPRRLAAGADLVRRLRPLAGRAVDAMLAAASL